MPTRPPAPRTPARAPASPGVFWRRRAMVAATAVLLVVATIDLFNGDGSTPSDTAQRVVATPTPTPTDAATTGTGTKNKKKNKKKQATATPTVPPEPVYTPPPLAEPEGTCADDDISITPVMGLVVAGRPVLVTLELRTTESEACTWSISRDHLAYKITDDQGEDVWSSSQCPGQVPQDEIVVRSAVASSYRLAWNGRASSLDCPASMRHVSPGDYHVQAAAIGGEPSAVVPFELADPADVVVNEEPLGPPVPETATNDKNKNKNKAKSKPKNKPKNKGKQKPTAD